MKPRLSLSLAILLLSLTACAMRPAEAGQVPPLVVERVVTLAVATTPLPTLETGAAPATPVSAPNTAAPVVVATATPRPPTVAPPSDPVGLKLTQPIDGNTLDGLVVRILQPGFNPDGMNSLGFRAYARVAPGKIADGNGIAQVRFRITGPNGFEYEHTENSAPYCLFQESSGTQCRALRVGDLWWGTTMRIAPGAYILLVEVQGNNLRWQSGLNFKLK
ncbi:MAG: hypothetical protein ABIQ99_18265 [Thermoflexales bacterium]